QRLPTARCYLVERAHASEVLIAKQALVEGLAATHARVLANAVQVAIGEQALSERREHDRADAMALERVEQLPLDPTVQQRIGRLVDQQRRAELRQDRERLLGALRGVGADPDVQRLALAHRAVERAHRLA